MKTSDKIKIAVLSFIVAAVVCLGTVFFLTSKQEMELKLNEKENPTFFDGVKEQSIPTEHVPQGCLSLVKRVSDGYGKYPRLWEASSLYEYDNFDIYQVRMVYGNYDRMFISDCKIDKHGNVKRFRILSWKDKEVIKILK